ncbi:MAG: undecaprenyl-diphosphate phosphatase, partial [Prevotella sp.]|nr:undecaprenyl-diphosphate phosphatase [Prevotella sp.]
LKMAKGENVMGSIETLPLIVGFLAAFVFGCIACKWMISIVKRGKLVYFGIYCAVVGAVTIICSLI